jgi:DNA-binding CsgD family transcriptional regulator
VRNQGGPVVHVAQCGRFGFTSGQGQRLSSIQAERSEELLRELWRQAARSPGPDLRWVLNRLHEHLDAHVALVGSAGVVEAATANFPQAALGSLRPSLARLSTGRKAVATAESGGLHVHLEALGPNPPRPVLVVAGDAPLAREAALLVSDIGGAAAVLLRLQEADASYRGYQHKARQMRFAVFQALMAGDVNLARRMTTGAVPELLEATTARIHLLECTPADRDRLAVAFQDPSGYHDQAIMAHCPVYPEQLICVIAEDGDDRRTLRRDNPLLRVVHDNPGYALGISAAHPLESTAQAYEQARHSLAVARGMPDRVASYRGDSPLTRFLPQREVTLWAHRFLRPLASAPALTTEVVRLSLMVSRSGAARMLGISRNTVTAHIGRAERLLAMDLDDVRVRAVLHLALAVDVPHTSLTDDAEPPFTLAQLLSTPSATTWAETFLHPVGEKLRTTLRAWIEANTDAQRAARMLGISRNTVRAHLRTAEGLLGRELLATGLGVHDVVHALGIMADRRIA